MARAPYGPHTVTHSTVRVVILKSRRTRERVLALTAALSFVGLLLGAPPFRFGETLRCLG